MNLDEMTVAELKRLATERGVDLGNAKSKVAILKIMRESEGPAQVALYVDHNVYHPRLGKIQQGYNVFDLEQADLWLKVLGARVRVATPQEVAEYYGV